MQPISPAPSPGALVVRTDRAAIDRLHVPLVIASSILLGVCLAMIVLMVGLLSGGGPGPTAPLLSIAPFVLVSISSALQLSTTCFAWGARRTLDEVVVADDAGLRLATPRGRIHVPWEGVLGAELRGSGRRRRLLLRLATSTAIGSDLSERDRTRIDRHGAPIGAVGLVPGVEAIAVAIARGTRGRVQAR